MIAEDVVFLLVVLVPLFAARWRISLLGLSLQGLLLFRAASGGHGVGLVLDAVDFLILRGMVAPLLLYLGHVRGGNPHRNDVIPANLFAWVLVVVLATAAFRFASVMDPEGVMEGRIAVATAALVLGFFVLASQNSVFSQIVGVLRIENAVALFELVLPRDDVEPLVHVAQIVATAGAAGLVGWYLSALQGFAAPPSDEASS